MIRKWSVLGGTVAAVALLATGFSIAADDEDSPLHKVMEKVQSNNTVVLKGTRNAVMYKKSQGDVVKAAEELLKLAKEAKPLGDGPAKAQSKTVEEWTKLADGFVSEAEKFSTLMSKTDTKQADAKAAYKAVQKSCTECHTVFRIDE
jgi:cytochrome c556